MEVTVTTAHGLGFSHEVSVVSVELQFEAIAKSSTAVSIIVFFAMPVTHSVTKFIQRA
jgi:hypothetical protein